MKYKKLLSVFVVLIIQYISCYGQVSLTNVSPSSTIDFSASMQATVGNGAYTAAGFQAVPAVGQLNSNAWAVNGWSDGNLAFGGTRITASTDYTRGLTALAVGIGGFYSFTGAPGSAVNPCFMIQPGTSDLTPGYMTLKIQNNGTTTITDLAISYNLYIRNDQGRSNSFNFSYSPDDLTYTPVAALDYTSIAVADGLGWVQVGSSPSRSTAISGLSIAPSGFFYIRWSTNDIGGSGSRDEFGLDDITITAVPLYTAVANGDWSTPATWDKGAVPPANSNVLIPSPYTVFLTGNVTRNSLTTTTVAIGGTLATANSGVANANVYTNNGTTNINGTFRLEENSTVAGTGTFVYGASGTLNFANTAANTPTGKSVATTDIYWPTASGPFNVNVIGDVTMNASRTIAGVLTTATKASAGITTASGFNLTINGTLQINNGGAITGINASAPIYGSNSLLLYNTAAITSRSVEWVFTGVGTIGSSAGYPNNVQISSNTTLNYNSNVAARAIDKNLTIDNGSTLDLSTVTTSNLTVGNTLANSGTVTLSSSGTTGGNLLLGGNFSNTATGIFTGGNRSIYFSKTGTQTVQNLSASPLVFPYVLTSGSGTTIQLLNNLTITSPSAAVNGGVALTMANASDVFDLNGNTLTIGTAGVANTISNAGSFKGSTTSNLTLLGTGSIGSLKFASNTNLGTFTIDRSAAAIGCAMGSALTVNTSLVLTNGLIDLVANTMTLASTCSNSFTASSNSYVIADATVSGGVLSKVVTATGTAYVFPVGLGGYSPATVNFSAGTFSAATFGMAVKNTVNPNWNFATTAYLNRYWSITTSGLTTPTYDFSATFPAADVVGGISTYFKSNQWDGSISDWTNGGTTIGATSLVKTGCTVNNVSPIANHISAAIRDQEIDIRGGGNVIVSGATTTNGLNRTAFGTQTIGTPTSKTYTIFNVGGLNLTIGAITIAGANPGDFVVTLPPASPVTAESSTTFTITFTPSYAGYRTATVSIANNDGNENPYTFVVDGTGDCSPVPSNTITPTSGPVGTEVTITATANTLYNATASINGVSATISNYSPAMATATVIKAIIPATAVSGTLITTNNLGCQGSNVFTVLDNIATSCQGGSTASELFMSEVTDSNYGALTYIEIYNGTTAAKNLSTYSIKVANNGGVYTLAMTLNNVVLPIGSTYVVALGNDSFCANPGGNGSYAAQTSAASSINFAVGGHDHYALFNGVLQIDSWGVFGSNNWAPAFIGTEGATFRRKNTATLPSTIYSNADWNIIDFLGTGPAYCANNDYSDIGIYNFRAGIPPTVSPLTYTPTCKATTLTVTGTEGFVGGNPLVYTWYAVQNGSNTWNLISDGGVYSGATTNALTISNIATLLNYQFYCQVRENTATCYIASNAVKITSSISTTWQAGNTWSNLVPTLNTAVIINNDYDTANGFSPSFDACSLTINSGKTVTIRANDYVNIQNDLTVTGNLNIENNGSLVMIDDNGVVTNTGTTQVKRTAAGIKGYDYVYWSSPVTGQFVDTIYSSPAPGPIYKWNPLAPNINSPTSSGTWQPATGIMAAGTGYIVRGSSTFTMAASPIPSIFTGAVNSGIVPATISRGSYTGANYAGANTVTVTKFDDNWNLVGNPYPSSIKALDFLTFNTNIQGFVYLWTHGTAPVSTTNSFYNSFAYNYTTNDYIAYNGTGTTSGPAGFNGYIASGQGFLVSMNDGPGSPDPTATQNVNFKNSMRNKTYANSQFYRTSQVTDEKHRIWLDILDASNQTVRTLVGYVSEATLGLDRLYDAYKNTANGLNIYSLAQNETLTIQGRPVPFDSDDQVPIGVRIMQNGEYKIAIAAVDGLFSQITQNIYLEDKLLGVIYDLRQNPYIFNATAGIINDRFVLRYNRSTLKNPDFEVVDNNVILTSNHGQITIKSYIKLLENVTVFDILGRQLFEAKSIGSNDFKISNITNSQQALIVKIKLENGLIVTRKIIL
ncbi:choice-of-anchor D domain-containing protein [Flavobacterium sp.]|uniref:choice-of-anchor D domain-containing protein n=1 Tax=Flavobacterium sp. TaxID=239 RepID=UPI0025E7799C|nr:choice-of-anchor D domain-containing protein [Flavobacterium sp.]